MRKFFAIALFAVLSSSAYAMMNEYGVISKTFQVDLNAYGVFYRSVFHDDNDADLSDDAEESQLNLMPTIRVSPARGIEFSFSYPIRDDGMKSVTGVWGPILGFKYGSPSSAGFIDFVFPAGSKKLLGNGEKPSPALIFGGSNFYGDWKSFGVRLHSWYFWDFNDRSSDELYVLIRPEFNFGTIRVGLGFPFEFLYGSDGGFISNTPCNVRTQGYSGKDEFGYTMSVGIEPKVTVNLGLIEVEPYFHIPIWEYTNDAANLYYGYTLGCAAHLKF